LVGAVERFPNEPLIHYNLGCYACQMGNLDAAKQHLKRAFNLQPKMRFMALDDEDLKPLWGSMNEEEK
jgi:Tfp pilus assembly protein PilF